MLGFSLEQSAASVIELVREEFPIVLVNRKIGNKTELVLAAACECSRYSPCVSVTSENDQLTGYSRRAHVSVIKDGEMVEFDSGGGIKLDRTVDGWRFKNLEPVIRRLDQSMMEGRGWRFDC